jgi:hypothetical protein
MSLAFEIRDVTPIPAARTRRPPAPQQPAETIEFGAFLCRCPCTQEQIASGIEMDHLTFRKIGKLQVRIHCRSCHTTHLIRVASGALAASA